MNPVPVVTVGVRALGLVLILLYAGSIGRLVSVLCSPLLHPGSMPITDHLLNIDRGVPEFTQLTLVALGLYLFLGGRWVIGRLTRGLIWPGGGTCRRCGYDISGIDAPRCPECGTKLSREYLKR